MPWVQIGLGLAVVAALAWVVYLVGTRMTVLQAAKLAEAEAREAEDLRSRREARMPGASAEHPIEVSSTAVIEPRASSLPCPRCGGPAHVDEHEVVDLRKPRAPEDDSAAPRLRVVQMRCGTCGHRRPLYFSLRASATDRV